MTETAKKSAVAFIVHHSSCSAGNRRGCYRYRLRYVRWRGYRCPLEQISAARPRSRASADALPVCLFVMILGGFLGMMTETGALDNGIAVLVQKLKGNEIMLIPVLMFIFSLGGTTYGMCEETVPFYALLAATMMAAGFDPMVGAATVLLGAGCGCLSTVNPFAVGAAVDALTGVGIEVNQSIIIGLGARPVDCYHCYVHPLRHELCQEGQG